MHLLADFSKLAHEKLNLEYFKNNYDDWELIKIIEYIGSNSLTPNRIRMNIFFLNCCIHMSHLMSRSVVERHLSWEESNNSRLKHFLPQAITNNMYDITVLCTRITFFNIVTFHSKKGKSIESFFTMLKFTTTASPLKFTTKI